MAESTSPSTSGSHRDVPHEFVEWPPGPAHYNICGMIYSLSTGELCSRLKNDPIHQVPKTDGR